MTRQERLAEQRRLVWRIRKRVQRMIVLTQFSSCRICGNTEELERHHIDGNIRNNNLSNLTVICKTCHIEIHKSLKRTGLKLKKETK